MQSLYTHRSRNIRKTWLMFSVFLIAVIGLGWVFAKIYGNPSILGAAVIFSLLMSVISYWFSDKIVIAMAGAREVKREEMPELYEIMEKLAREANLPMPRLFIVPEMAPNAFATGRNPKHAVVAVTAGLLEKLNSEELEGVLAHELSHIGNRDMLVSTVAVVLAGFISILSDMLMRSMFWGGIRHRDSEGRGGNGLMILGLIVAFLAPIGAMLLQLAISRKREFLADASGAILTKKPENLANALIKIAGDKTPMIRTNTATAHLWLADPFKNKNALGGWYHLFMTHPPVEERVKALTGMSV
jgi:heat shock protein HtpX